MKSSIKSWKAKAVGQLILQHPKGGISHYAGNGVPLSRAIAYSNRLTVVTAALVPLMKHTARTRESTTDAARLFVAWYIISVIGIPVLLPRTLSTSPMQKSITKMNTKPLWRWSTLVNVNEVTGKFTSLHQRQLYIPWLKGYLLLDVAFLRSYGWRHLTQLTIERLEVGQDSKPN